MGFAKKILLLLLAACLLEARMYTVAYHGWDASPATLSSANKNARGYDIACNDSGRVLVVWGNDSDLQVMCSYSTDYAASWSDPIELGDINFAENLSLALNNSNQAVCVWLKENASSDDIVQAAYSLNGGAGWSSAVSISSAGEDVNISPQSALNDSGQALAVWGSDPAVGNDRILASYSADSGSSWSSPVEIAVSPDAESFSALNIAFNNDGHAIAVWLYYYNVYASSSSDGGASWSSPVQLSGGAYVDDLHADLNDAGQAVVVWENNNRIQAVYSVNSGSSWSAVSNLSKAGQVCVDSKVSINSSGRAVAIWRNASLTNKIQADYSADGGASWLGTDDIITLSETFSIGQQIALNDAGRAVAVWIRREGAYFIVKAVYSTDGGASWLPDSAYALSLTGQNASRPLLALDAAGWSTVIWVRSDGSYDRTQVNNDYNAGNIEAKREKIRFPLAFDLVDKISWSAMDKVSSYHIYSDPALQFSLGSYTTGNFYLSHQRKKGLQKYYFTVVAEEGESAATEIALP